jgi:hypothetical protein
MGLIGAYLGVARALVLLRRSESVHPVERRKMTSQQPGNIARVLNEIIGLFVDDGAMALGVVIWVALLGLSARSLPLPVPALDTVFFIGLAALLSYGVLRARR